MGFLDQISKTLSQGVDRAKFEADKFQKTTRLQGEVNEFRRQLDTKLMEMGQRAYDLQRAGQISAPSIGEMAVTVDQIRATLLSKEEELKVAQNDVFIEPGVSTPSAAPVQSVPIAYDSPPIVTPPAATGLKACASCGFQMPSTAMFCPNCGSRVA
ncbi:MAG: zinc ribbon domain-containing protein [Oscillochloris sp.]|nr:zinc ribbon domain-containing protein [Oscillochloris sp.]